MPKESKVLSARVRRQVPSVRRSLDVSVLRPTWYARRSDTPSRLWVAVAAERQGTLVVAESTAPPSPL